MQFTRALVFLVCTSYTLAVTCAVCPDEITAVPFASKCYKPGELTDDGPGETVCLYQAKDGVVPTAVTCTYDNSGVIIRDDSVGTCAARVLADSKDCPPCLH